jgi:hypothetical protein
MLFGLVRVIYITWISPCNICYHGFVYYCIHYNYPLLLVYLGTTFVNSALHSYLFFFLLSRRCSACANIAVHLHVVNKYRYVHEFLIIALKGVPRFPSKVWNIKNNHRHVYIIRRTFNSCPPCCLAENVLAIAINFNFSRTVIGDPREERWNKSPIKQ